MKHIFLSYSTKDIGYVERLDNELKANDYTVWRDKSDLRQGDQWVKTIEQALQNSWLVIVVQSPDSRDSRWVFNEIEFAQNKGIVVFPILLRGDRWFGLLHVQAIDIRGRDEKSLPEKFYDDLLQYAPPVSLEDKIDPILLKSQGTQRISLMPELQKLAQNMKSPKGQAAYKLLLELSRDPGNLVSGAAQIILNELKSERKQESTSLFENEDISKSKVDSARTNTIRFRNSMENDSFSESLPVEFQRSDLERIFSSIRDGESCYLVGIGSVGKSDLISRLLRKEVQKYHLGEIAANYLMVRLSLKDLIHLEANALEIAGGLWQGYELMLYGLRIKNYEFLQSIDTSPDRFDLRVEYELLHSSQILVAQSGLRYLNNALYKVFSLNPALRIVFIFDEIERFIYYFSAKFFSSLRGLKDEFKEKLVYIATTRTSLEQILLELPSDVQNAAFLEEFFGLFIDHQIYIGPLDLQSTDALIASYISRYKYERMVSIQAQHSLRESLSDITCGHIGLLKRSIRPAIQHQIKLVQGPLLEYLLDDRSVNIECRIILNSLSNEEKLFLYHFQLSGQIPTGLEHVIENLWVKNIILSGLSNQNWKIIPLLEGYIKLHPESFV